jgi:exopolysaccharide biosynthesis polyprenyl glycosylphosphotransferase
MTPRGIAAIETVVVFVGVIAMAALWVRPSGPDLVPKAIEILAQASVLAICCIVSFYYHDLYDFHLIRDFAMFVVALAQSLGVAFILIALSNVVLPETNMANGPFVSSVLVIVGLLLPLRAISYAVMRSRSFSERVLIVGRGPLVGKLVEEVKSRPNAGITLVGVVDDGGPRDDGAREVPVLGPLARTADIIDQVRPHRIVVALAERRGRMPVRELLEAQARGVLVEDGVQVYERLTGKLAIESLVPSNLMFSSEFGQARLDTQVARAISLAVSMVGLITLAPLMVVIAVAIKADSRGPVFFVQDRVGLLGRAFRLIKFRTMHETVGPRSEWVRDNEERITRVGRWLRTFRLDELPQFINILRGDMNLVGPRPHPIANLELFREQIPYYSLRCAVRPGVTGWAQIRYGYANSLEEEIEKMRYDLFYVKNMSLAFDLRIVCDSLKVVCLGRGATRSGTSGSSAPEAAVLAATGDGAPRRHG